MSDRAEPRYPQSGVIPFRSTPAGLEILLITTSDGKRWGIPKGMIEPDLSPAESAAKEAWEEAGIRGRIDSAPLGEYWYDKWGGACRVVVYALRVDEVLQAWPESHLRRRQWFSLPSALGRIDHPQLQTLLNTVSRFHGQSPGAFDAGPAPHDES